MASIFTRRVIAYIIDFFVVSAFMWIVSYLLFITMSSSSTYQIYHYLPYVVPFLIIIYFTLCDKIFGATVGKALMYLKVVSKNGSKVTLLQALVRNLTKIYWIPIIFDWIIGKILRTDRLLNNITKTAVVNELQ